MVDEINLNKHRSIRVFVSSTFKDMITGHQHPHLLLAINNYAALLQVMGWSKEQIIDQLRKIAPELFNK